MLIIQLCAIISSTAGKVVGKRAECLQVICIISVSSLLSSSSSSETKPPEGDDDRPIGDMDLHVCKERRNSNPESVMNCNNASGAGGLDQGPETASTSSQGSRRPLNLQICPTTGGLFQVDISADHTVQCLKKQVSKKLGVPQDRISLLHKERYVIQLTLFLYVCPSHDRSDNLL